VVLTLPVVIVILLLARRWGAVVAVVRRLRERPALVAVLVANGLMLGVQLWLFAWAPQSGHGLDAALGYLLLPLVMVLLGVVIHRERLSGLRLGAVAAAAVGVAAALVVAGGLSWVTLAVAFGYPVYFAVRRHWQVDTVGAFCLELVVLFPVVVWILATEGGFDVLAASPSKVGLLLLLGGLSGVALILYLEASRLLPFGLFGLLTYLEPVLLAAVSVLLLGEVLTPADVFVYGPIAVALGLLAVEPFRQSRAS
jgi:chloramphenicol-sensitive protein RarD